MKPVVTKLVVMLLFGAAAMAQSPPSKSDSTAPTCTDLSGKIPLPCPGQKNTAPARPAKAHAPAPVPDSDVQGVSVPSAQASQRDASAATGLHPVSATTPPPIKVEATPAEPQPSASSSTSAAVVLTQGCTDLSGQHAVPCPAKTYAVVATGATRGPDAGPGAAPSGAASSAAVEPEPVSQPAGSVHSPERALLRNLFADQKAIWGSPLRIRLDNVQWLVPLLGGTALVIGNDRGIESHIPTSTSFRTSSNNLSNYGVAAFAGVTGATWLWGVANHNDKMRETGVLSGEAALDSLALTYAIKSITNRDRPYQSNGHGNFWSNGDSFPSEHASAAWSVATVFAHEYPGPLTKLFAYGGAAAISAARVTADKHFASDALVGSALGYFIGRQVYRAHHDQGISDAAYGTFERARAAEGPRDPAKMGSTYVALDSWVYDAMDRLAALGYIKSAFAGLRPWTRMECARLLQEGESHIQSDTAGGAANVEAMRLFQALRAEFLVESRRLGGERNLRAEVESVYTRFTGISGKPLNDSYHFGQTIINDYGRPYQEGFNMVTGFTSHAEAGPLAFYVRGEYQHAPSAPALAEQVRNTMATLDGLPVPSATPSAELNRFRLLDAYVALNLSDWQFSFGKQSLWWGPGLGGPMMFSNNAEPINMLRFNRVTPIKLPSIFGWLGPIRTESFLGQLSGYEFIDTPTGLVGQYGRSLDPQPFIHGEKISFEPTPNFEFGVFRTTIYGGPGYPLTMHAFFRSLFSTGNERAGAPNKPGDRRSGVDFTYRLPGLRNWLTFYGDGFTDDEFSPIAYPDRSVWHAGLYLSHFPRLSKLDLRTEGVYTDNPIGGAVGPGFYYQNGTWKSGYRNDGNLIGSWIGRAGQGAQAWATYHFDPKNFVQLNFRHQKVSREFISGGGTLTDIGVRADLWTRAAVSVSSLVQYERWTFPVLATGAQSTITSSVQLTFRPRGWGKP
ncbi:MAG: capsule assembly Wzi family protein [Terriglobales bacterium]